MQPHTPPMQCSPPRQLTSSMHGPPVVLIAHVPALQNAAPPQSAWLVQLKVVVHICVLGLQTWPLGQVAALVQPPLLSGRPGPPSRPLPPSEVISVPPHA